MSPRPPSGSSATRGRRARSAGGRAGRGCLPPASPAAGTVRRGDRVWLVTARGYDGIHARGIADRRWRLRHPADPRTVEGRAGRPSTGRRAGCRPTGQIPGRLPTAAARRAPRRYGPPPAIRPASAYQRGPPPMFASRTTLRPADVAIRAAIVALALATGYIHYTLGGLLFTLNALGYLTAAVAIAIPLALAVRFRWAIRLGLMGYAATTIVMWAIQGPYYSTAYVAKIVEVALIALLAIDFVRHDGNPVGVIRREFGALTGQSTHRGSAAAGA